MNDMQRATKRTTFNASLAGTILIVVNTVFDWNITLEELAPFIPVLVLVYGIFYRLSLVLSKRWPTVGWVLFLDNSNPPQY